MKKMRHRRRQPRHTNHFKIIPDSWDVSLICGATRYDEASSKWVVDEEAPQVMDWGLAKNVAFALLAHIAGYEHRHGPIRVQPTQIPELPRADQISACAAGQLAVLHRELFYPDQAKAEADAFVARTVAGNTKGPLH